MGVNKKMIVKVYKMNMLIKNEIKPIKMVLLDDLLELDKILKGNDSNGNN